MKVIVLGGTGHVGQLAVKAMLADGHAVTAFGRSIDKIDLADPNLSVVKGDVTEAADVDRAIAGHDVAVLTFGAPLNRDTILHRPDLCRIGTANVIEAMTRHGTGRLVAMTSIGAGDSAGHGRFVFRNIIEPVMLGRIMEDRTAQEEAIRASSLPEWVIVRPTELADGDPDPVRVITDLETEAEPTTITRASVGRCLSQFVTDRSRDGQAVVITN